MNELDAFLDSVERELSFLDPETAKDIKEELRSHILDSAEASGRPTEEIVRAMGDPKLIARRYREEFNDKEEPRVKGIHIEFGPDEESRKGDSRCPGGDGPWPHGCFDIPPRPDGCWEGRKRHSHGEDRHGAGPRGRGPWERGFGEMGDAFGQMGRDLGQMGRDLGRMARDWARDAEDLYEPGFRDFGRRMRDFFNDSFASDDSGGDSRELEFRYPAAKACHFDFTGAKLSVKRGEAEDVVLRVLLRARRDGASAWKPEERRTEGSLSLSESFSFPPFPGAFAKRVEIEIPDGVETVELRSLSGSIEAEGLSASILAASASGDIRVSGIGADVRCRTASGDIDVSGVSGKLEAQAVSGDIGVRRGKGLAVEYSSVSGKVKVDGDKAGRKGSIPGAEPSARLSTVSGDIEIDFD